MLSLTNEKEKPTYVGIVKKDDKKVAPIYLYEKKDEVSKGFSELDLSDGYLFQQVPNDKKERDVLFVAGKSGSGKSYYTREYIKQYHKMFPKRDIYLISYLDEDETLDAFDKLQRVDCRGIYE